MNLYDLIAKSASKGLTLQRDDGSFPEGHNGPWYNEETPVRSTSHWALILHKAFEITEEKRYLSGALKACDFLLNEEFRPYDYTFHCLKDGYVKSNRLIGQAWAIEPLIFIGERQEKKKYKELARDIILLHPYNFDKHGWESVEIDGTKLGVNKTVNQQIWFSAMALVLSKHFNSDKIEKKALDFFQHLPIWIKFLEEGLIEHNWNYNKIVQNVKINNKKNDKNGKFDISIRNTEENLASKIPEVFIRANLPEIYLKLFKTDELRKRSIGYLSFIIYGLAVAHKNFSEGNFWRNDEIKNIVRATLKYIDLNYPYGWLDNKDYRWHYNPVGIEMAYGLENFKDYLSFENNITEKKWLSKQIRGYYDFDSNLMTRRTNDPTILAARLYEAIRLKNYKINF